MCISPSTVTVNANINNRYVNLQDYTYAKMAALTLFKTHYLKYLKTMIMDMSCNDFEDYINYLIAFYLTFGISLSMNFVLS